MTSLLQFKGIVNKFNGKVGLEGYLSESAKDRTGATYLNGKPIEEIDCPICNKKHPQLYRFFRKPAGRWGQWVVFRYNGKENVPDLSTPLWLDKIPYGAIKLSPSENHRSWVRE